MKSGVYKTRSRGVRDKTFTKRIGVLGGTFDPIHIGHLIIAEEIRNALHLEKVLFVPVADPPHKDANEVLNAPIRAAMVSIAISDNPYFELSSVELERVGKSFTVDTLLQLKKELGEDIEIFFIIGSDNVSEIPTWKDPNRIFELCTIVAATRPGFNPAETDEKLRRRILFVSVPPIGISSSELRERLATGKSIKYLVPPPVEEYIYTHKLYRRASDKRKAPCMLV